MKTQIQSALKNPDLKDRAIQRTSNPDCPACTEKRMHRPEEWTAFHPDAGKGRISDTARL
jgi:hypothetical protein